MCVCACCHAIEIRQILCVKMYDEAAINGEKIKTIHQKLCTQNLATDVAIAATHAPSTAIISRSSKNHHDL